MILRNVVRGRRAKTNGIQFEELLKRSCIREGVYPIQIPAGCRRVGKTKIISVKTPFDFVLIYRGRSIFVDAKTYENQSGIRYSNLSDHQVRALYQCAKMGAPAGYITWHRKQNNVIFYDAISLMTLPPGKSIDIDDGIYLGTIDCWSVKQLFELKLPHGD